MNQQRNIGICHKVIHLLAGRVGGHDDGGQARVRGGRQVGVIHERDVGDVIQAGGQMEEAGVLETLHHLVRELRRDLHVGVSCRGFVVEWYLLLLFHCDKVAREGDLSLAGWEFWFRYLNGSEAQKNRTVSTRLLLILFSARDGGYDGLAEWSWGGNDESCKVG